MEPQPKARDIRGRPLAAHQLLFPAAAAFAALAIPWWRGAPLAPDLSLWHGHEMLFGYALAVIAGFLVARPAPLLAWALFTTWLAGRIAVALLSGPLAAAIALSFPLLLLAATLSLLLRPAKRATNRIAPAVIAALLIADALWWAGALGLGQAMQRQALLTAVDLLALLTLVIGGRALPAAVGGYLERHGIARRDHVRGGYELPLAALIGGATVCDAFGLAPGAGVLCVGAALLTAVRVVPWQLERCIARPELWALALGYLWLIPGLLLKGVMQLTHPGPVTHALHGITVGAIGTLTLVMMARTALLRAHLPLARFTDIGVAALMLSAAALARLLAPLAPRPAPWLWLATALWSAAFLLLMVRLLLISRHRSRSPGNAGSQPR